MPLEGPCANPDCPAPDNASGQFQLLPEAFCVKHGLDAGSMTCKKADCLRWGGLKAPKQKPGRKRAAACLPGDVSPVGVPVSEVPCPPIIASVEEIWGVRCVLSWTVSTRVC